MEQATEKRSAQFMEEEKSVELLQQQLVYLQDKVDRLVVDCKKLLTDKVLAVRNMQIYETCFSDLVDTVEQSSDQSQTACDKCTEYENTIKRMHKEMQVILEKIAEK